MAPRHLGQHLKVLIDDDLGPSLDAATGERNALGESPLSFQPLKLSVAVANPLLGAAIA